MADRELPPLRPRNPEMDAIAAAIHGSPAFTVANAVKAVRAAMTEYAFQGFVYGEKSYWADAYVRLGDARRAAKQWVDRTPSRTATLLCKVKTDAAIGALWKPVGEIKWTT